MPMFLKLTFQCDDGSACRSGGQDIKTMDQTVPIGNNLIALEGALKTVPGDWRRGQDGRLQCNLCSRGPANLL